MMEVSSSQSSSSTNSASLTLTPNKLRVDNNDSTMLSNKQSRRGDSFNRDRRFARPSFTSSSSVIHENDLFEPCFRHIDAGSTRSVDGFVNINVPNKDLEYTSSAENIYDYNHTSDTSLNHLVNSSSHHYHADHNRPKRPSVSDALSLRSWSELSNDQTDLPPPATVNNTSGEHSNPLNSPMKLLSNKLFSGFLTTSKPSSSNSANNDGASGAQTDYGVKDRMDSNAKNPFTNWMRSPSKQMQKPVQSIRQQPKPTMSRNVNQYDDLDDSMNPDKVKTKLLSMWNNVKYGWTVKLKTNFNDEAPLFLLGRCYHRKIDESQSNDHRVSSLEQFRQDFSSRIWFTYRREFPQLMGSTLTTDCGWGCMLRSGQMMLAQALILHFLGRDWRWYSFQEVHHRALHRQIIRWFSDLPSNQNPFSVHRLVKFGELCLGKKPGDWYGPASVAHIMREAMDHAFELNPLLEMCVYVAYDCTVYIQDVVDLCTTRPRSSSTKNDVNGSETAPAASAPDDEYWKPVIILIPIRLGGDKLNSIYMPCVRSLFSQDNCLGIIGGRPKHSLYFVGFQDDKLIHLDPHYCQDVVDTKVRDFPLNTFHCLSPRKMSISRMDPSCTIGFYCKKKEDFFHFVEQTKELICPPMQKSQYPMFIFVDGHNEHTGLDHICQEEERYLRVRHCDSDGKLRKQSVSSEDFVFL